MAAASTAQGVRARAREQMRDAILDAARAHLASEGASGLSLRAVARDVGMVSSALYRYFDSRDALLTALIIDAYDSLGAAVEQDEAQVPRDDMTGRWLAVATGVRRWALANPHLYALVYGSPVPGYAAPQDTVPAATRVTRLLAALLGDVGARPEHHVQPGDDPGVPADVLAAVGPVREFIGPDVPPRLLLRGLAAWSTLFGAVSLELFGQLHDAVEEDGRDAYFEAQMRDVAGSLGLT